MISSLESWKMKIRHWLSPSRLMIRLLGLHEVTGPTHEPGLILIQIDGLSWKHFQRAMKAGHMPFLKKLYDRERYRLWKHYSGVPSNTPAVQGEIFYGVRQSILAFSFKDCETDKVFTMYENWCASKKEADLRQAGVGLLERGSSYGNIFAGGAEESSFTAATFGWGEVKNSLRPRTVFVVLLFNLHIIFRVLVLLGIEFWLAVFDFFRGVRKGQHFMSELSFVPTRVGVSILLRELIAARVKVDIARGLPVIHMNFFGYDEQAHRRGPSSWFAYWSLRGIDSAIRRITVAARRSVKRHYDVWVYSDHGQEDSKSYAQLHGKSLEKAVQELFEEKFAGESFKYTLAELGEGCLYAHRIGRTTEADARALGGELVVTAKGPIGCVYPPRVLSRDEKDYFAGALVEKAHLPVVVTRDGEETSVWIREGKFSLEEGMRKALGEKHPYRQEVTEDLRNLCRHRDCGPFLFFGWREGQPSVSFPIEGGSHGGIGPEETEGFALFPPDAPLDPECDRYLRPLDIRQAALYYLDETERHHRPPRTDGRRDGRIRVMTYNVHGCIGMDNKSSPERIARVIARHNPDIVALQEVDRFRSRTRKADQAEIIARALGMSSLYHAVIHRQGEDYGNVILSRFPLRLVRAAHLPVFPGLKSEPRGALWAEADLGGLKLNVINTHLSLWARERKLQTEALLSEEFLGHEACHAPVVVMGDLNAAIKSSICGMLGGRLANVQCYSPEHEPLKTWSGRYPVRSLDHIFISEGLQVENIDVPATELEKMASDHLPVIAELRLAAQSGEQSDFVEAARETGRGASL